MGLAHVPSIYERKCPKTYICSDQILAAEVPIVDSYLKLFLSFVFLPEAIPVLQLPQVYWYAISIPSFRLHTRSALSCTILAIFSFGINAWHLRSFGLYSGYIYGPYGPSDSLSFFRDTVTTSLSFIHSSAF